MNETSEHLTQAEISRLVLGQSDGNDLEQWLAHMEQCEQCLASVDQAWPPSIHHGRQHSPSDLESARIADLQDRVLRRIHVLEMGKQTVRLAILGPIAFLQGMLGTSRRKR